MFVLVFVTSYKLMPKKHCSLHKCSKLNLFQGSALFRDTLGWHNKTKKIKCQCYNHGLVPKNNLIKNRNATILIEENNKQSQELKVPLNSLPPKSTFNFIAPSINRTKTHFTYFFATCLPLRNSHYLCFKFVTKIKLIFWFDKLIKLTTARNLTYVLMCQTGRNQESIL